jgi:hypothetical protein
VCARNNDGSLWLLYDNDKSRRLERRIPILESLAHHIEQTARQVAALFPNTPRAEVALFPAQTVNRLGRRFLPGTSSPSGCTAGSARSQGAPIKSSMTTAN